MKKLLSALVAMMLIFSATFAFGSTIPEIENKENCVVDMADVITQDTENYLSALNYDLQNKTGASIVIATVDFTGSYDMSEYAYEAFKKWGVGDKDKDNGLLLLMSVGQEDYWAVQGSGIEKDLTSAEIDQMLWNSLEEDFAREDYDAGAKSFYLAAYEWFGDHYDVELLSATSGSDEEDNYDEFINSIDEQLGYEDNSGISLGTIIMWIVIIVVLIIIFAAVVDNKRHPATKRTVVRRTQRRGPHTSSFRRAAPPPQAQPKRNPINFGGLGSSSRRSSSSSRSSSTSRSSSSRSGSGRSGGFGGGSTRGGGVGRRR